MSAVTLLRRLLEGCLIIVVTLLLGVVGVELTFRVLSLDDTMITRSFYYQVTEVEVHRIPEDKFLRYDLRPSSRTIGPNSDYTVNINAHGSRGVPHPVEKEDGVFRIFFMGPSTVYGAGVNDDETIPARLELELNNRLADLVPSQRPFERVEVWNFGVSAYRLSQMARLARRGIDSLEPDLVLMMVVTTGRRPFLGGDERLDDYTEFFAQDPSMLLENFDPPEGMDISRHARLFSSFAIYRYARAFVRTRGDEDMSNYGDWVSRQETARLEEEMHSRGGEVVYPFWSGYESRLPRQVLPDPMTERIIDLYQRGQPQTYYEIHPPDDILWAWARQVADGLIEGDWLPRVLSEGPGNELPSVFLESPSDASTISPGDEVTWFLSDDSTPPGELDVEIVSDVAGSLWRGKSPPTGELLWVVPEGLEGVHAITVLASDEQGALRSHTIALTIEVELG